MKNTRNSRHSTILFWEIPSVVQFLYTQRMLRTLSLGEITPKLEKPWSKHNLPPCIVIYCWHFGMISANDIHFLNPVTQTCTIRTRSSISLSSEFVPHRWVVVASYFSRVTDEILNLASSDQGCSWNTASA